MGILIKIMPGSIKFSSIWVISIRITLGQTINKQVVKGTMGIETEKEPLVS